MQINILDFIGLFLFISGFIVGLGAVTVIDISGFLGRKSSYWTEATIRVHKITKPLIWLGIFIAIVGGSIFYRESKFEGIILYHFIASILLILNGLFLSFKVSPYLLQREQEGKSSETLPKYWQNKIAVSMIVSDILWGGSLILLVLYLLGLR